MTKFEIGKKYFDTSACNHECIYVIEIVKRTDKTVTFIRDGKQRRAKLFTDRDGEYIIPDRYSMAPVFRATREYQPEAPSAPAQADPAVESAESNSTPSNVITLSQSTDNAVIVMLGQRLELNCGACLPIQSGTVIGFYEAPETRFSRGGVRAVVRWDGTDETGPHTQHVELSKIHPHGWRSANGSPLGVFVAR